VHIIDYFQPQLGYQETFLTREQAKMGHEVYVVTSDGYSPYMWRDAGELLENRIRGVGLFTEEGTKVWRLKVLFKVQHQIWLIGLEKKIREIKPDIIIIHGIVSFSAIRIARLKKKLGNFKLIYDDHMKLDASKSKLSVLYPLFKRTFSRLIQEAADALVGIGDTCKVFMNVKYGIPLERITVIPLGADDELFRFDAIARQEIRSKLAISESDMVFIYTGQIAPFKKVTLLIEAVPKLMKKYSNLRLLLVGSGPSPYIERMKQDIKAEGLEDRFIWHDVVHNKELYKFYSAADVAVWPCGATISQREAMSCRLPIIISEDSLVTELVSYNNGLICREEDACDVARQMEKLLDPKLRSEMGNNSRKFVEERFTWRIIAKQFLELVHPHEIEEVQK